MFPFIHFFLPQQCTFNLIYGNYKLLSLVKEKESPTLAFLHLCMVLHKIQCSLWWLHLMAEFCIFMCPHMKFVVAFDCWIVSLPSYCKLFFFTGFPLAWKKNPLKKPLLLKEPSFLRKNMNFLTSKIPYRWSVWNWQ